MSSLHAVFDEGSSHDIHTLGRYIEQHISETWLTTFQACHSELLELYPKIGDTVYGVYGKYLFQHIHDEMKTVGLRATPKLPGNFSISREWGEEDNRQRWMWSKISTTDGRAFGTIVTIFWHDHNEIRIPRPFQIIALAETTKGDVVRALSARSPEFKQALEAREEFAAYAAGDTE